MNWKPYVALVKVSQSLTFAVGVNVGVGPPGVTLGFGVLVGPTGVVGTLVAGELVGVFGTGVAE